MAVYPVRVHSSLFREVVMFTNVIAQLHGQSKTVDVVISEPNSLIELLMIYQKSDKVKAYRVIPQDQVPVKNFKTEYGWGHEYFDKNQPDKFDWTE